MNASSRGRNQKTPDSATPLHRVQTKKTVERVTQPRFECCQQWHSRIKYIASVTHVLAKQMDLWRQKFASGEETSRQSGVPKPISVLDLTVLASLVIFFRKRETRLCV